MIAGIDIGTSSVKVILFDGKKTVAKAKSSYNENSLSGFLQAIKRAVNEIGADNIDTVGLSSQVGTYITDGSGICSWSESVGKEECEKIRKEFSEADFINEISMPHPRIYSYPIPRIMYFSGKEKFNKIGQPKDYICEVLTGNFVSDMYSWRGLVNLKTGRYSEKFLRYLGIKETVLPKILPPFCSAGKVTPDGHKLCGLNEGTNVCVGLNDFYASLISMGTNKSGDMFDITGTSEHLGIITDKTIDGTKLVTSPFFDNAVTYGVTASSGASTDFGIKYFGVGKTDFSGFRAGKNTPIFLPYLNGERAPIFDPGARGVFFGISSKTTSADMAYSVLEANAFSLYDIYSSLNISQKINKIVVSGGSADDSFLCKLKADVLGADVVVPFEKDTSALGAVCCALVMSGKAKTITDAGKTVFGIQKIYKHEKSIDIERFNLYKKLYEDVKKDFKYFTEAEK